MTSSPYDMKLAPSLLCTTRAHCCPHGTTLTCEYTTCALRHGFPSSNLFDKWPMAPQCTRAPSLERHTLRAAVRGTGQSPFLTSGTRNTAGRASLQRQRFASLPLQGEGGRLWGVTERRAFVLAFDGTVTRYKDWSWTRRALARKDRMATGRVQAERRQVAVGREAQ